MCIFEEEPFKAVFHYDGDMTYCQEAMGEIMVEEEKSYELTEIDPKTLNPMRRQLNRSDLRAFINQDIMSRSRLSDRKSYIYYDANGNFVIALYHPLSGPTGMKAAEKLGIVSWSKGC